MPSVSVIMPMYNAAKTVGRAVDSIVAQTMPDWELIVVDDASRDDSMAIVRSRFANDARIKVLELGVNSGPSVARNTAIEAATGEWVALLDADDAWRPDRLETLLHEAPGADFVADNIITFDANDQMETGLLFAPFGARKLDLVSFLGGELGGRSLNAGLLKPLMRRAFIREHRLAYDPEVRFSEDMLFYCKAIALGAIFKLVHEAKYVYTMWVGRSSKVVSQHSHTKPDSAHVARKLSKIYDDLAAGLGNREAIAFENKIAELYVIDEWYAFRAALNRGTIPSAVRSALQSAYVRHRLAQIIRRRLGLGARGWGGATLRRRLSKICT